MVLPTSTGAADSDEVVVFNSGALAWNSDSAANAILGALQGKYGDWTLQDFEDAFGSEYYWDYYGDGEYGTMDKQDEMRAYLAKIADGTIVSDEITPENALAFLQNQLNTISENGGCYGKFPVKGLDLTGLTFWEADLTTFDGLTKEQLLSADSIISCIVPDIVLSSGDNLPRLDYLDISKWEGLTSDMLLSMGGIVDSGGMLEINNLKLPSDFKFDENADLTNVYISHMDLSDTDLSLNSFMSGIWYDVKLPSIAFTGEEDLSEIGYLNVDYSSCTGMRLSQFNNTDMFSVVLPAMDVSNDLGALSSNDISGTDFTRVTGLTGDALATAWNIDGIKLTSQQWADCKAAVMASPHVHSGTTIYVDGVKTKILQ